MTHWGSIASRRPAWEAGAAARLLGEDLRGGAAAARRLASLASRRPGLRAVRRAARRSADRLAALPPAREAIPAALAWLDGREKASRARRLAPRPRWVSLGATTLTLACAALVATAAAVAPLTRGLPGAERLSLPPRPAGLVLTGGDLELLGRRGVHQDRQVTYPELPEHLIHAVVAIEDQRFFVHPGIDPAGIARALYANLVAGHIVEGASTITQQLARNLYLSPEMTLRRKVREAILAVRLEATLTKREIIETYLNRVYFGAGAYGIEAAARTYFGKAATELSLAEAALLAGLLKAPTAMSTGDDLERATARGRTVLRRMLDEGYISDEDYGSARLALALPRVAPSPVRAGGETAPYLLDWVAASLGQVIDDPRGALIAETTLDPDLQATAEAVLRRAIEDNRHSLGVSQGAIVVLDSSGAVRAMVGGLNYEESQFNRAVQARRQPGSAFKPFVYLTALGHGLAPSDRWLDRPVSIGGWRPENYGGRHRGRVTLDEALTRSINSVAVDLANRIGLDEVARTARALGIESPIRVHPSLALGTSEVTLLELTSAYAALANGGVRTPAYAIRRVLDPEGHIVYRHQAGRRERVADPRAVARLNTMLTHVIERGTGRAAALEGHRAAGKTGTNQDYRDAWFIGFTPTHTVGVWVGNDDFTPMNGVTGGGLPAEIWREVMAAAIGGGPGAPDGDGVEVAMSRPDAPGSPPFAGGEDPFARFGGHRVQVPGDGRRARGGPFVPGGGDALAYRQPGDPFADHGAVPFSELAEERGWSDAPGDREPSARRGDRTDRPDRRGGRGGWTNDRGTTILLGRSPGRRGRR